MEKEDGMLMTSSEMYSVITRDGSVITVSGLISQF